MHLHCLLAGALFFLAARQEQPTVAELLNAAREAVRAGKPQEALRLADRAVARDEKSVDAWLVRGKLHDALREHKKAVADYDRVLALQPNHARAHTQRGSARFCLGQVEESIKDFDRFLELSPQDRAGHWQRGIALYYASRFDDGKKQFEAYEQVDTNDVENAVWHFLCAGRANDVESARKSLLKIGSDQRVPMMEVYALFAGTAKPEDVLAAAQRDAKGGLLNRQLFYAHLYLGLYWEVMKDADRAFEHIRKAADEHRVDHYMWNVACVHRDLLKAKRR